MTYINTNNDDKIAWFDFPLDIKWYITSKCNLRCKHCYLESYKDNPSLETCLSIIDFLSENNVRNINLIGGEPLIRKDLYKIVERISSNGITCSIATNGSLITKDSCTKLISAGCKNFQISLDSDLSSIHDDIRGHGSHSLALDAIRTINNLGGTVSICHVVNKKSFERIQSIIKLSRDLNVKNLKITPFLPIGSGQSIKDLSLSIDQETNLKFLVDEHKKSHTTPIITGYFSRTSNCDKDCTFGCGAGTYSAIINSDFTISACDMLTESDRTKETIENPKKLPDLWNNDPVFRKWRGLEKEASAKGIRSFHGVHKSPCFLKENQNEIIISD
ncbi:radical SAM protein [Salinibius halmophilus]|uniref:radical SAM protein n=1 Tax=Salinibius halmophilus TaxID=1853216 RepID=UPI000E6628AA|nr:radical SAM protein [Salinibius halmophilus]